MTPIQFAPWISLGDVATLFLLATFGTVIVLMLALIIILILKQ